MKAKIFLSGASGKMGSELQTILSCDQNLILGSILDRSSLLTAFTEKHSVWIDFSEDRFLFQLLQKMQIEKNYPTLLTGTTNLSEETRQELKSYAKFAPVLWTPNTSLGVGIVESLFPVLASSLKDYEWSIEETHHIHKKDSPSGTASRWSEKIQKLIKGKDISITSHRESEVIGTHILKIKGPFEEISIQHKATDRRLFAQAAIKLVQQLRRFPCGYYEMESFLSQGKL